MLQRSMNMLALEIKTVAEAPHYKTGANGGEGFKGAKILKCILIRGGTIEGNDTVDIQFEDEAGNKYVAMTTARLLKTVTDVAIVDNDEVN